MALVKFDDVWEMYRIKFIVDGRVSWENFWALKGVSFELSEAETLGIIGENGAGKSTILKLIAGMLRPDRGKISVTGRVSGLLELGAGFQPELTGRENLYLSAGLFGLSQNRIEEKYEEIVNFAELGKFIYAPVKCYSQGMFIRLAFAIAIHMEPDILLIDDTLAVGDEHFQGKCIKKIFEIKEQGKAIIFVTHDMRMLRRLCKRALFLRSGRIVSDDLIDRVIPLYTQMSGSKEGVGMMENGPLNLVFNNGRLFLNWRDKLITVHQGGYAVFSVAGKWHSSLQADWEIKKEDRNKLVATGRFCQLALTQTWRLELINNCELRWDIEITSEEPIEIEEGYTNIMLTAEYTQWFTSLEEGVFPSIDEKNKNFYHLLDANAPRKCVGVKTQETSGGGLPSFLFEQSDRAALCLPQISNSDYVSNCRVLQFKAAGLRNYSARQAGYLSYFSGKMLFDMRDMDVYLKGLKDDFALSGRKLKLTFDNGQAILAYDGKELTRAGHISSAMYINGRWHYSRFAQWKITKEEDGRLIAQGAWRGLPLVQVWELEMPDERRILLKIKLLVNEMVDIEEQYIDFMCSKDYTRWFCDYGEGEFPPGFLEIPTDIFQKCIPDGAVGLSSRDIRFPDISLKFSRDINNFAKILNSDFHNKARILRINKVEPEERVRFLAGEYQCFAAESILGEDRKKDHMGNFPNILRDGRLRFIFESGRGRLYWEGVELTKKLGVYTSLRSRGRWHDSATCTLWKVEEKDKMAIVAEGRWLYLPISQHWRFSLKHNFIEFDVKMKVSEKIEVDRLQTNIMLSERYSGWVTGKNKGYFPFFKADIDDEWDCVYSAGNDSRYIGVLAQLSDKISLPMVSLLPSDSNLAWSLNIINSDIYHRGRVLQCLNAKKAQIPPGEYHYFSGRISVES